MAIPLFIVRHYSPQPLITLNMACADLTSITYQHSITFLGSLTFIACVVHLIPLFIAIQLLIILYNLNLFLNKVMFSFKPKLTDLESTVWTFVCCLEPTLHTLEAKYMLTFQLASFFDLLQAYPTLIIFQLFQFLQPLPNWSTIIILFRWLS